MPGITRDVHFQHASGLKFSLCLLVDLLLLFFSNGKNLNYQNTDYFVHFAGATMGFMMLLWVYLVSRLS